MSSSEHLEPTVRMSLLMEAKAAIKALTDVDYQGTGHDEGRIPVDSRVLQMFFEIADEIRKETSESQESGAAVDPYPQH
jgi:hypothetical protein